MTIHVNIGEAKTRLSELVAAVLRGEEVVLQKAGVPKAKIVSIEDADVAQRAAIAAKRVANLGFAEEKYRGVDLTVPAYFDEEYEEERYRRKFGEPAA
ncbi:MAG TPA: type II toxin-antitoxin system prevent-host-death family antitoxin [Croceibacterium sp.]